MNCLDFRRRLLGDPFDRDTALHAHEAACPACAGFARELRADEIRLRALLRDVAPPVGMAERIQLAARYEQRAERRRGWWYAVAASVLLAVGASMVSLWTASLERGEQTLAQSVLNHIQDESRHLREARPIPRARVKFVFERFGAELAGDIGPVNFAAECLMRHKTGVHLVMPGKMGPVTAFFMPGEMTDGVLPVRSERFDGRIVPTSWGSIAVVGENGEPLDGIGERLASAVRWPENGGAVASLSDLVLRRFVGGIDGAAHQQDG
ncbi:MAG: DUF3379 family protein [Chromatiaceae bacterium]|nr:DUF3379 family protein [Chromatiaceae bacterium]MCP5422842.1 DUF3379 family protein [Chromatiaceae bacterium]